MRGTHYLVKADFRNNFYVKYTLVIDFTSLSKGDQLMFQHHSSLNHHSLTQARIHKIFPKITEGFIWDMSRKWGDNHN